VAETGSGEGQGPGGTFAETGADAPAPVQPAAQPVQKPGRHIGAGTSSIGIPAAASVGPSSMSMTASGLSPAGGLARKRQVMDHFLLALRTSELARVVDPGTLHYWLDSTFQDHTRGGALQLQGLFATLLAEPGVEARMLAAPLLALKSWETKVGMRVVLPPELEAMPDVERKQHLVRFPVQLGDVDRLLGRVAVGLKAAHHPSAPAPAPTRGPRLAAGYADPAAAGRAAVQQVPAKSSPKEKPSRPMTKSQRLIAIGGMVMVATVTVVSLYMTLRPMPIRELDAAAFSSTGVPVIQARRKGTVVVLTVGPQFAAMPREAQVAACDRALRVVAANGATGVHLVDVRGNFLLSQTDLVRNR